MGSRWGRFREYRNVHEWRQATFGDVRRTWDPTRKDGFAGYASKRDWRRATFGDRSDSRKRR